MQNQKTYKLREDARDIFYAGLKAVDPAEAMRKYMQRTGNLLRIGDKTYDLEKIRRVLVVGTGKAGFPMAKAVEEILKERISAGIVIVKSGYGGRLSRVQIKEASHPIPDENGVKGAKKIASLVEETEENDLVICIISGGGSALLTAPVEGISLEEKQKVTQILLRCGASIQEINCIRKHLSSLKGGQLARKAYPAHLHALILSDVIGDRLDTIASGPTVPDESSFQECERIIRKYEIKTHLPGSVIKRIEDGIKGSIEETPKPGEKIFNKTWQSIIGSNILALQAAKQKAVNLGYNSLILSSFVQGETREVAEVHAAICQEILSSHNPLSPPGCILSGGETTVTIKGDGLGGRNQEFSLAAAIQIKDLSGVLILSAGTDGTDGPTDAAGAFADGSTWEKGKKLGLDPQASLDNNDSYHFFEKLNDLFITGPTNTNVMDLRICLIR